MALSPAAPSLPATTAPRGRLAPSHPPSDPPTEAAPRTGVALTRLRQGRALAAASVLVVLALLGLEVVSISNHYALRVTADTPTFLALIRDLAVHPLRADSVFFATADTHSIHGSPYLQVLGLIWKAVAPAGRLEDPIALGTFVAIVTIPVTLFVLSMLWLYARALAGKVAAFVSVPALLLLFGPVHLAYPSDLSLNGFLCTGYFPTTFATATMLLTLVLVRRRTYLFTLAAVLGTAVTVTTDALNGAMLSALMIASACAAVTTSRKEGVRIPLILAAGFLVAQAWPVYDVFAAFKHSGLPVPALLVVAFAAPQLWLAIRTRVAPARLDRAARTLLSRGLGARGELRVALFGAWAAAMIAVWGAYTMRHWPRAEPIMRAYRLGFYWNYPPERWLLLLLPGALALVGLHRLLTRHRPEPLLWFAGFFAVGFVGSIVHLTTGYQIPLYYRFVLLCQIPVAVGAGAFIAQHRSRAAARVLGAMLACIFAFKVVTLLATPTDLTYFGSPMLSVWKMGEVIPPDSGAVASDPITSYYMPITTHNRVITMGLGHTDSGREADRAIAGYGLLHEVYAGNGAQAVQALSALWQQGVRWFVVEKFTTLLPPDLGHFTTTPYTSLVGAGDVPYLDQYYARLSAVGAQTFDDSEYTVFKLDGAKLAAATRAAPSIGAANRAQVSALLARLPSRAGSGLAQQLYRLGVRRVGLELGALDAPAEVVAYGGSLQATDVVAVRLANQPRLRCPVLCSAGPALAPLRALGAVDHSDPYYGALVQLAPGGGPSASSPEGPR